MAENDEFERPHQHTEPEENVTEDVVAEVIDTTPFQESPINAAEPIEREYTQTKVNLTEEQLNNPIPEPHFEAPPSSGIHNPMAGEKIKEEKKNNEPLNPDLKDAPTKDKRVAAEHLTGIILDGYEQLHMLANSTLKIPEKKLNKLQAEGEIDLRVMIPYDYGKETTAGEVFQEYNAQMATALEVTPKFKEEVRPLLVNILTKRGAGMTDEQMLIYMFGKDMATKMFIWGQMRKQAKDMITMVSEVTKATREHTEEIRKQRTAEHVSPVQAASNAYEAYEAPPTANGKKVKEENPKVTVLHPTAGKDENFQTAPPQTNRNDQAGGVQNKNDHSTFDEPIVNAGVAKTDLTADNIDGAMASIAKENEQAINEKRNPLSKENRSNRAKIRVPESSVKHGKKGAPTKEEKIQRQLELAKKREELLHNTEEAEAEITTVVSSDDESETIIVDITNTSDENLNDIDL